MDKKTLLLSTRGSLRLHYLCPVTLIRGESLPSFVVCCIYLGSAKPSPNSNGGHTADCLTGSPLVERANGNERERQIRTTRCERYKQLRMIRTARRMDLEGISERH